MRPQLARAVEHQEPVHLEVIEGAALADTGGARAGADRDARDRQWLAIRAQFESGVDWSGLERERVSRWYRQLHIFEYPFYYIEYGIAQLGALQLWRDSLVDPAGTMQRYKQALALGGTRSLPDIYAAAGARLIFDEGGMRELVELVEARLAVLRGGDGS